MHSSISVIKPADDISLITLPEAKIGLKIPTSDGSNDELLEQIIQYVSGETAALCNRTFAEETIAETFYDVDGTSSRVWLSRWPVKSIASVTSGGDVWLPLLDYNLDAASGKLTSVTGAAWGDPVTVVYRGGYLLPFESPQALRQVAILLGREAYFSAIRGDASVRMISHKDSRIIYFDQNAAALKMMSGGGGQGGTAAQRAASSLLKRFMRFEA